MKLSKLLEKLDYTVLSGSKDIEINNLAYDSRKVEPGDVFVCLKGYNVDAHKFAQSAVEKGAVAIVLSDELELANVTVIKVDDTRKALAYMSASFFGYPAEEMISIALTGTKGKTTTASMIHSILEHSGIKTGTIGTLGIVIGDKIYKTNNTTPESFEIQQSLRRMVNEGCKAFVIEASSLGLKWHRTDAIYFDYGVFTNFSHDHIGDSEHATLEEYLDCKKLLFKQCKLGIINKDSEVYEAVAADALCPIETFGFTGECDVTASQGELTRRPGFLGVSFTVGGYDNYRVNVGVPGKFNIYNALAAISVCRHCGADVSAVLAGLENVKVKGRVEPVPVSDDFTLLIDYAHNALSMENVLTTLRQYNPNRLITMFGAGGDRPKIRRYEMGEISGNLSDLSVITEDNSRFEDVMDIIEDIKTGISKTDGKYVVVPNRKDAIRYCINNAQKGDIIVLAGKGHEDYQEIKGVKYHMDERELIAEIIAENN
ncbi:MAG: UDP-N-acetylmuramoyl-L-alanyl-D-glutamate--2,6-diaminopimelate ligase [Acutalibacteraceae bacterium]|nr:UDP-N-acetylmuramoyl-L-alanyl-D-glutamate--2,6-diaminopimelate ligase [Acutalibacteraceae bacterium]